MALRNPASSMPYWRLSAFYFCYFAVLGVLVPYWGLYLKSLGFGAQAIGFLMAIPLATKIVAPNIWGWLADTLHGGRSLLPAAAALALLVFLTLFGIERFIWLALAMAGFSFFWNATLPSMEATTLNFLGDRWHRYGEVRLWGSVGFIVLVWSMGWVVDGYGASTVVPAIALLLAGMWVSVASVPQMPARPAGAPPVDDDRSVLRGHVIAFLACCMMMQAAHAPFYAFFTLYLERFGYDKTLIGGLWALGVAAEILVFVYMHRLFGLFRLTSLLLVSFLTTVLRWLLVAFFPEYTAVVVFSQLLHAVTFGVYHASAIQMIHRLFRGSLQHRGQALYSSMSFGVGGALGSLYSGYIWEHAGPSAIYVTAAAVALVSAAVTALVVRPAVHNDI